MVAIDKHKKFQENVIASFEILNSNWLDSNKGN